MSCISENLREETTSAKYRKRFIDCKKGQKQILSQKNGENNLNHRIKNIFS